MERKMKTIMDGEKGWIDKRKNKEEKRTKEKSILHY